METDSLVQTLAIWGAITGSIGTIAGIANLILRFKQHRKDQSNLSCTPIFSFEHSSGEAIPKHKLVLRSIGRRPVTIDYVRYFIKPKGFWAIIFKSWIWSKGRWKYDDVPKTTIQIEEGQKKEFNISMPNGLIIQDVVKVVVYDQSGKGWNVKWPSSRKIANAVHSEHLYKSIKNLERLVEIISYSASSKYFIYVRWNPNPQNKNLFESKLFCIKNEEEYKIKLNDIINVQQPKMLTCESNEVA